MLPHTFLYYPAPLPALYDFPQHCLALPCCSLPSFPAVHTSLTPFALARPYDLHCLYTSYMQAIRLCRYCRQLAVLLPRHRAFAYAPALSTPSAAAATRLMPARITPHACSSALPRDLALRARILAFNALRAAPFALSHRDSSACQLQALRFCHACLAHCLPLGSWFFYHYRHRRFAWLLPRLRAAPGVCGSLLTALVVTNFLLYSSAPSQLPTWTSP